MISSIASRSIIRPAMSSSSSLSSSPTTTTSIQSVCNIISRKTTTGSRRPPKSLGVTIHHRSHSTTGSLLTPEEKREIFVRKSKELHQAMDGVLGERNAAKETIARVSFESQKQQQPAGSTTTSTTNNTNNTRQSKFQQAMLNVGVSFVTVVLAAQVFKTSVGKRKAEISLEAAVEVLEEKRSLLAKVQNESDLRNLAKQCVDIIRQYDGTNKNSPTVIKSTSKSSWGGWLVGSTNDADDLFREDDGLMSNPNSDLEERIFRTLSNHVHQVVGDAAYTADEKDRREIQKLVSDNINEMENFSNQQQQQQQLQLQEGSASTNNTNDESERLLNELVQEQMAAIDGDGTTQKVVKRQVFQI